MSGRKNFLITLGFILSISLIPSAISVILVSHHYSKFQFDLLNVICGEVIEQKPEDQKAVASVLKKYTGTGTNSSLNNNFLPSLGYHKSDFAYPVYKQNVLYVTMGFCIGIFLFIFTFLYRNKMEAMRIQALADYLEQVNTGKSIILPASGEDDFSKLEDEIYKTVTYLYQTKDSAVKAKNDFAKNLSNIAHQIKTPITAISLSVQTLQNEYGKNQLKQIQNQLFRLIHLEDALLVILDDASFLDYCKQIGITPQLDGAIIRNLIRDVTNPDFRHPRYMPYVKEGNTTSILSQSGNENITVELPVLSYTNEVPVLKEEYATLDYYELVHFVPVSLWRKIKRNIGGTEKDTNISILSGKGVTANELSTLQKKIEQVIGKSYMTESENRIQELELNHKQIKGMMTILGGFCFLLAIIGIGNVFSNTPGFVHQRKREFARYMSVGMTPKEIRKMFCIEAFVIAGRPILLTLPLAAIVVRYMLHASFVEAGTFLAEAPFIPISIFMFAILATVTLAYYLGWRNIRKINLAEVLQDDTMI